MKVAIAKRPSAAPADNFFNTVQCGDCTSVLSKLPDACVDTVITSPPYFQQRDYTGVGMGNEAEVSDYLKSLTRAFREVVRVTKPTGNIVYNIGDKYKHSSLLLVPYRFAISATEEFPVKLVNNITWVKRNPTPRQFARRLVSATEPFFHFVKTAEYYYARDEFQKREQSSTAWNLPSSKMGDRYRKLIAGASLTKAQKQQGLQELEKVIQEVKDNEIKGFRMKIRGIHAPAFGGQNGGRKIQMEKKGFTIIRIHGNPMKRDVMESAVESGNGSGHTAVYPISIVRELLRMLCPPNGIVLDPYMGSGTTIVAAKKEGRVYLGIDISPEYCSIARKWVRNV